MSKLHYLTPQDFIWINHRVTRKVNDFNFRLLEDGVYQQYGYLEGVDLVRQAARMLTELGGSAAFLSGNRATAFVGFVSFLEANGLEFMVNDDLAGAWLSGIFATPESAEAQVRTSVRITGGHCHEAAIADVIAGVLVRYPKTIQFLQSAHKPQLSVTV